MHPFDGTVHKLAIRYNSLMHDGSYHIITLHLTFLFVLQSLLDEPNPNSPANSLAAQLYQENRREYEKKVSAIVEQSWLDATNL